MEVLPVTERLADSYVDGDQSPEEFLRRLRSNDAGIFNGYRDYESLWDVIPRLERAVEQARECKVVVMSGCGTSGRMAWLAARRFAGSRDFRYCMAGGESALVLSDELPEDDAQQGAADLKQVLAGEEDYFLIGISCGLSAAYVAGQVMATRADRAAVIGFNPVCYAKPCMAEAVARAESAQLLLNPIIGPEAVSGSSRMKGGTTTWLMLELICSAIVNDEKWSMKNHLQRLQNQHTAVYQHALAASSGVCAAMVRAATAIRDGGRLIVVGGADSNAPMALVDLSEMPDSFGAAFDSCRAFSDGGWPKLGISTPLHLRSHLHRIDTKELSTLGLSAADFVVQVGAVAQDTRLMLEESLACEKYSLDSEINGSELSVKIVLNAISTFAQARGRQAVLKGRMISMAPANEKIWGRCRELIAMLAPCDGPRAQKALIQTVHRSDGAKLMAAPLIVHLKAATPVSFFTFQNRFFLILFSSLLFSFSSSPLLYSYSLFLFYSILFYSLFLFYSILFLR